MSATIVELAELIKTAITTRRDSNPAWDTRTRWSGQSGFVLSDFKVERSWLPHQELPEMPVKGQVWLCHLAEDDIPTGSRANTTRKEIPVQVAFQRVVDPHDVDTMDQLAEFVEQLREVCRLEVDSTANDFSWNRNEALKDDNETPYSYTGLREGGFFEAYFTTYFNYILA